MKTACVAVVFGLGGGALDPAGGESRLVARLKALGVDTGASPYQYYDTNGIVGLLRGTALGKAEFKAIVGDSLGACNAPFFAQQYGHTVDYIAGFQPSEYGMHAPVPPNVVRAHCIYDPYWIDTWGLGHAKWELAPGNRTTKLILTEHRGAHPDDWGYSQDLVFAEIKSLIGA